MTHTTTYRQKDSGWQIIVSWKDTSGKWKQKSKQGFLTKKAAKEYEQDLIRQIKNRPQPVEQGMADISLTDFCDLYIAAKKSVTENTKRNYKYAVKALSDLANKPVRIITFLDLQRAVSAWSMKPQTQKQYQAKLNALFKAAVKPYGLIAASPMQGIETEKAREKKERLTISETQFQDLLKLCSRPDAYIATAVCYYTGLRRSECLALTWQDINFTDKTLTVNKQVPHPMYMYRKPVPLKTKNSYRTIPIPQALLVMLHRYHNTQPMDIARRLFPRPAGTYRIVREAIKKLDNNLSPHCLRHTYATNLLAKGMDIRTVAALMGDDTKTVINTYVHYTDDMRKAAAESIEKIFAQNF